ncbi:MAG: hypothetical protein WCD00_15380 [Desulfuromonadaceae bacterium]
MVPADNRKYTDPSIRIMKMMHDYHPLVEVFSIDEAWIDVTGSLRIFGGVENIAYQLKSCIKYHFDIACSHRDNEVSEDKGRDTPCRYLMTAAVSSAARITPSDSRQSLRSIPNVAGRKPGCG